MEGIKYKKIEDSGSGPEEIKTLFRGVWADELYSGQELPVGGSIFSEELTSKLKLDFDNFEDDLGGYTEENMIDVFKTGENQKQYEEYLNVYESDVDSYLHFICFQIQNKVARLLEIDPVKRINAMQRNQMFSDGIPNLSDLKGKSMCAERAALAQFLLQRIGIESAYVSGVSSSVESGDDMEDHSFVVLKNRDGQTLIFDVARPNDLDNMPAVYKTGETFDYELLAGKEHLLVEAEEVLHGNKVYFGVGDANAAR